MNDVAIQCRDGYIHRNQQSLDAFCSVKDECLHLNYVVFKNIAQNTETKVNDMYENITEQIVNGIDFILSNYGLFTVHVNLKSLTISDIEKHKIFISRISVLLKDRYPNKLDKCFIHNPPFIFEALFNLVAMFIDKDTQRKITLVKLRKDT